MFINLPKLQILMRKSTFQNSVYASTAPLPFCIPLSWIRGDLLFKNLFSNISKLLSFSSWKKLTCSRSNVYFSNASIMIYHYPFKILKKNKDDRFVIIRKNIKLEMWSMGKRLYYHRSPQSLALLLGHPPHAFYGHLASMKHNL